tara:strand:- start:2275 stop:2712 length:438 start_codon:yes stop_codon:yes gene_type:complete
MDLSKFDSTQASNVGKFLHLLHPATGAKLMTDPDGDAQPEPIGFTVKGPTSTEFKGREKRLKQKRLETVKVGRGGKIKGLQGSEEDQRELYAACVTSYINCVLDGKPMPEAADVATTVGLFERIPSFEEQVIEFVDDEANWLGES